MGVHARPAGMIANAAARFESDVKIVKDSVEINAKSIMGILTLGLHQGSEIILICEGADEGKAVEEIGKLFQEKFNEE